jgi:hypothetical protein
MGALAQYDYTQNRGAIVSGYHTVHAAAESASAAHCVVFDYTRSTLEISVRTFDCVNSSGPMADELLLEQTWRRG